MVVLVMKEGDRLEEHSASGPITLSVHEGVSTRAASGSRPPMRRLRAEAGTLLACDAGGALGGGPR
jgi:hypothetical protein